MNPAIYIAIFLPAFISIVQSNRNKRNIVYKKIKKRRIENMAISTELIKGLINKKVIISTGTFGSAYKGIIEKVEDDWIKINTGKTTVILSIDYITSITQKNK